MHVRVCVLERVRACVRLRVRPRVPAAPARCTSEYLSVQGLTHVPIIAAWAGCSGGGVSSRYNAVAIISAALGGYSYV